MLPDSLYRELAKRTPLQRRLIEAAWPSLSTGSKLTVIEITTGPGYSPTTPEYVVDLAQTDSAEIVRYWASLHARFRHQPENQLVSLSSGAITPEEAARIQRLEADPSELVRAAGSSGGLLGPSQLSRLVAIRKAYSPSTHNFADFLEKAIAAGEASENICECIEEYFAREDVFAELKEHHRDGGMEYLKGKGWAHLWQIAAKADPEIGYRIVDKAAVSGGFWRLEQDVLEALPPGLLATCMWRREDIFEKARENVRSTPDKYDAEVVKSVKQFDEMRAEYGTATEEETEKARLERMHSRTEAVFESVQSLQGSVDELKEWTERSTVEATINRKLLEGVKATGWLVAILLGLVLWLKH
jgi:hypothetical protein